MSLKEQLGDTVLVIAGADSLVGESLLEQLAEAGVPAAQVIPLLSGDEGGARLEYGATRLKSRPADQFEFSDQQTLLIPPNVASLGSELIDKAQSRGARVLVWSEDQTSAWSLLGWDRLSGLVAGPQAYRLVSPVTAQVLRLVSHIESLGQVTRVTCHAQLAVSEKGRAGVSELAAQTARILNVQDFDTALFQKQIAFNVIPDRQDGLAARVSEELHSLLLGDVDVMVSAAYVPVFFGHTVHVSVEVAESMPLDTLIKKLDQDDLIELLEPEEGALTPVGEAANQDQILVGDLAAKSGPKGNNVVSFWCCADNVRVGTARSGIQSLVFLVQNRSD